MENAPVILFLVTAMGAIYMLHHGLTHSKVIETVTGAGFGLISFAVFFGFNMHITTLHTLRLWMG